MVCARLAARTEEISNHVLCVTLLSVEPKHPLHLVKELREEEVSSEDKALAAAKRILESARQGPHSSVDISSLKREDYYER
jgi:hypothetical protein